MVVTAACPGAVHTSVEPVRFPDMPAAAFGPHPPDEPNPYVNSCPGMVAETNRPAVSYPYVDEYDVYPIDDCCFTTRPDCDRTTASDTT